MFGNISQVSIQSCEFNFCAKLKYRIKHLRISTFPFNESKRTKCVFLVELALYITKTLGEATEYNNFIYNKLRAPQSKQTKLNKCGHCFRSWMSGVWERSRVTVLESYTEILWWKTLLGRFKMTITTFKMLWNKFGLLGSAVPSRKVTWLFWCTWMRNLLGKCVSISHYSH